MNVVVGSYNWRSPAAANRNKKTIYINAPIFNKYPEETRVFILLHEQGHIELNTRNEFEADDYARAKYVELGYSLKQAYSALSEFLTNEKSPEQMARIKRHFVALLLFDGINNNNPKAITALKNTVWEQQ